jgi:hypothetical protein
MENPCSAPNAFATSYASRPSFVASRYRALTRNAPASGGHGVPSGAVRGSRGSPGINSTASSATATTRSQSCPRTPLTWRSRRLRRKAPGSITSFTSSTVPVTATRATTCPALSTSVHPGARRAAHLDRSRAWSRRQHRGRALVLKAGRWPCAAAHGDHARPRRRPWVGAAPGVLTTPLLVASSARTHRVGCRCWQVRDSRLETARG